MKVVRFKTDNGNIFLGEMEKNRVKKLNKRDSELFYTGAEYQLKRVELLPPVAPPNIIAVGLNYYEHASETGHEPPEEPVLFLKATSSVIGEGEDIILPSVAPDKVDYEAELGVVIGEKCSNISQEEAEEVVFGYTCVNDITARDCQENDEQWARAKSFDTFCPVGPHIETSFDPGNCRIRSKINDKVMQDSKTSDMIFSVTEIVSYCSRNMTLLPGTLIITGTPPGVGKGQNPPRYLQDGDEVEIEIEGIGSLSNYVRKENS